LAALILTLLATPLAGQASIRLVQETRFTKGPGAQTLGTLLPGADVLPGNTKGSVTEVRIEGWVPTASLGPIRRDSFDVAITKRPNENVRSAPDGAIIARVSPNVGFVKGESRGDWTQVKRTAWIDQRALQASLAALLTGTPVTGADRAEIINKLPLSVTPGGAIIGSVDSGANARMLARSSGWTRVQLDVWVPDSGLRVSDSRVLIGVSQAEVRANPARYLGQIVEWRLQFVAIQKADQLRPEIPEGQPYLLTRGPLPEPGFVYVIVSSAQINEFQAIPALKELTIRGTIKSVNTKYLPTPVLELVQVVSGLGH
jgi:hypothetical protein